MELNIKEPKDMQELMLLLEKYKIYQKNFMLQLKVIYLIKKISGYL